MCSARVLLHPQRGAHRTLGVVLVGDGGPEQRHDGVADDLVDAPAEGRDVAHEALEAPVDDALHLLGVAELRQRREADEVGEQDRGDASLVRPRRLQRVAAARGRSGRPPGGGRHRTGMAQPRAYGTGHHPSPSVTAPGPARPRVRGAGHMVEAPRPPAVEHRIRPRADDTGHLMWEKRAMSTTSPLAPPTVAAASTVDAVKIYGSGESEVRALDGVTVQFDQGRLHRDHGTVGLGQVDADALRRRTRPSHVRARRSSAAPTSRRCRTSSSRSCGGTRSASSSRPTTSSPRSTPTRTSPSRSPSPAASPTRTGSTA